LSLLIVVPARGGSKRLPGKNLLPLAGKSLLAHTAEAICASGVDAFTLLSTDSDKIAEEGERLGWNVPFRRPHHLAGDNATTFDTVLHAVDWYLASTGVDPSAVMVLQPTSPFRGGAIISRAWDLLQTRADIDSVIGMTQFAVPAARMYFASASEVAEPISEEARAPVYCPNGVVYLCRTAAMRYDETLFAGSILPLPVNGIRSIDVDTSEDFRLAEAVAAFGVSGDAQPPDPQQSVMLELS